MSDIWISVIPLAIIGVLVLLVVKALRTRDAGSPRSSMETKRVMGHSPGMHWIDSEEALRARDELPRR